MQPSTVVALAEKQTLLAIVSNLEELWQLAEEAETQEERDAAESEIARVVTTELAAKCDGIGWFERREEAEISLAEQMIADIQTSIKRRRRRIEQVRAMVHHAMERLGTDKLRGSMFTISIRQGSERVEADLSKLPLEYCRITTPEIAPNKVLIKKALQEKVEVPGARIERGPATLQIT